MVEMKDSNGNSIGLWRSASFKENPSEVHAFRGALAAAATRGFLYVMQNEVDPVNLNRNIAWSYISGIVNSFPMEPRYWMETNTHISIFSDVLKDGDRVSQLLKIGRRDEPAVVRVQVLTMAKGQKVIRCEVGANVPLGVLGDMQRLTKLGLTDGSYLLRPDME